MAESVDALVSNTSGREAVPVRPRLWVPVQGGNAPFYCATRAQTPAMKEEKYAEILPQAKSLCEGEDDMIANMANLSSLLHDTFHFWWTGFYRVAGNELVLGPFQGPLACTRIPFGKGVCGSSWKAGETIVVPDVEKFPGHIACSSESRSEIVVPVRKKGEIIAVLDIDSRELGCFDETDRKYLEKIVESM